ncbi:hypothetical protein H1R20_g2695, partial [Candolleomyces eurysporus]
MRAVRMQGPYRMGGALELRFQHSISVIPFQGPDPFILYAIDGLITPTNRFEAL